ncbi:hypothetical protein [Hippea maritima]|uniref:Uncharacterized protein n=1 Tax=Hippea maritima (strain ATCC 700847 / DSM 10411 / MH2) TaxID=760142 RepID=F2LU43_HIPMA|nr:hypothetical protein [Hippea maritima]AEA34506.1 hypothetical protein Hipma_1550 [Hippea maritima DSM 10411]
MIAYPKSFRERWEKPSKAEPQEKPTSKESLEVWKALTSEVWELAMSNYYFETWMWQFKKVPAAITRLNKLVNQLHEKKTAEIMENELRIKLDYIKNAKEMLEFAENKIEDTLRTLWAKKRELE